MTICHFTLQSFDLFIPDECLADVWFSVSQDRPAPAAIGWLSHPDGCTEVEQEHQTVSLKHT